MTAESHRVASRRVVAGRRQTEQSHSFGRTLLRILSVSCRVILGALLILMFAIPLLWLVLTPFNAYPERNIRVPRQWTFEHFTELWQSPTALMSLGNSLLMSVGAVVVTTVLGALAAYAFSRIDFPGADTITYLIMLISSVGTGTAAMVPLFQMMNVTDLIDRQWAVVLVLTATCLPTAIFMLKDFMDGVPRSYEESARLMGARPLRILWDVVVPVAKPGLAFIAVWTLQMVWSEFLIPYLLLRSADKQPAAVTMYTFYTEGGQADVGMLSAFALVYTIPVVILYLVINRRWGFMMSGGLKG